MKTSKLMTKMSNTILFAAFLLAAVSCFVFNPVLGATVATIEIASLLNPGGVVGTNTYSDTVLLEARARIKDANNKKFNLKPTFSTLMDMFLKGREYTIPELSTIRKAATQATKAQYLKNGSFTVGTTKECAPAGETSGSGAVELTWVTKTVKIKMSEKQFQGNDISKEMAFANNLYNAENDLWLQVETVLRDYLETNRSGVNNGGSGTFNTTYDIMSITNSNKTDFYNLVSADMQLNNYKPQYMEAFNTMWTANQRKYVNQGDSNSNNQKFQFDLGFDFHPSNLIAPGVIGNGTYDSIHYFVPEGGVAILDWNDPTNVRGKVQGDRMWGTYGSMIRSGITFDMYKTVGCADTSADGGGTQDPVENWELSYTFSVVKQPMDNTPETPILKYGTLTGDVYPT